MDQRPNIAIYLQHYLSPSMTFIYRQLKTLEKDFNPIVLCSDLLENQSKFPFDKIYCKRRNFIRIKKSKYFKKLFGNHTLLNTNPRLSLNQKRYFGKELDQNNIKLIHAHFGPSGLEVVDIARKKNIPLVVTFHGYDASVLLKMGKYIQNIKKIFDYAYVIAISESMKKDLLKLGARENNISVVRCGIPLEKFEFVNKAPLKNKFNQRKEILFLQVANFVEVKGHKYTIEAFSRFNKIYPASRLILAGDGPLRGAMIQLSKELDIENLVEFPGVVDEDTVLNMMEKADVFLYHSLQLSNGVKEGLPTALMEAMARGLTVISSKHSAIPELIIDGVNGFLVSERDVTSYFNTMLKLKESNQEIRFNARETILKNFSLSITRDKLTKIYFQMINKR